MKLKLLNLFLFFFILVACGEKESLKNNPLAALETSSPTEENISSSSVTSSSNESGVSSSSKGKSSSSREDLSSSSVASSSNEGGVSSSSKGKSSSSREDSSSSSVASSSNEDDVSSSSKEKSSSTSATIPSKLYDCEKYKCVTTKYLNPEIDYGEYLDERDSLVYRTVQIGEQVWLAQNLNHYTVNSYCYADKDINCLSYGRLYDWQSALSICPEGWHLPDTLDFGILRDYAIENNGGIGVGTSLMHGKSDKFGFSSLAHGGYKPGKDGICGDNDADFFWTTIETADKNNYAEVRGFRLKKDYMIYSSLKKTWYLSVRCIKD